jgi:hypothetical protein
MPESIHSTEQYENNRAERSHEVTRVRERGMRKFKSVGQTQRFLGAHAAVSNLFNLGRHLVRGEHYRDIRVSALGEWRSVVALIGHRQAIINAQLCLHLPRWLLWTQAGLELLGFSFTTGETEACQAKT